MKKALVLFSGGLDSLLVIKILEKNKIAPTALVFKSVFFNSYKIIEIAKHYKIPLLKKDFSRAHLAMVKMPAFGFGKHLNPCIDCHLEMLKRARKIFHEGNYDLIATGEVLGQRPMSQNKQALELIEKESRLEGKILRPLSAKLLPKTEYEKNNLISAKKLYAIKGKSRKDQLALAKKFNLNKYQTPSGGCLLTDREFSKKISTLLKKGCGIKANTINLLKSGRVFFQNKTLFVIGRNHEENIKLDKLYNPKLHIKMELGEYNGPILIAKSLTNDKINSSTIKKMAASIAWYYPKIRNLKKIKVNFYTGEKKEEIFSTPLPPKKK